MDSAAVALDAPTNRPALPEADHRLWQELVAKRCGLSFGASRNSYLSRRLWERMKDLGTTSYGDYYRRLAFEGEGGREWSRLLELLVNRETAFFRHPPSFAALEQVLRELMVLRSMLGIYNLTLWSAGCSTGEEVYSMAMTAEEIVAAEPMSWLVQVAGTDISSYSLEQARRGVYRPDRVAAVAEHHRRRHLQSANSKDGKPTFKVSERLKSMTRFMRWNLVDPDTYSLASQDVIFCQNLLVYLSREDRVAAAERLCRRLNPGGYLFLAPGEVVGLRLPGIEPAHVAGCSVYRRPAGHRGA